MLRRHVVERCIYAVDLDPLAVELCRLSLWIETMDRTLPFGFLDHKIKCGNALIGAWFDQFRHYPAMAWKNREGGDKGHGNGVHFEKEMRTKAFKDFVKQKLTPDLKSFLQDGDLFREDLLRKASCAHEDAMLVLAGIHALPVENAEARRDIYRERFIGSPEWRELKDAMDLWCACWFWPADQLDHAPLPTTLAEPAAETRIVAERIAAEMRFFHWELEFPDVFRETDAGFDAVLGNPPWETLQPNSLEFFSNIDPLYRSYGKQEALSKQRTYFDDISIERNWLDYNGRFANDANWMKHAGNPFGDPENKEKNQSRFPVARGLENSRLHDRWRHVRTRSVGFGDARHPFLHRGEGKAYTYKLFLEYAHALCRTRGRFGLVVPSGLYSDNGTGALRRLFIEHCRWEWLFGIENRERIFPIHRSYKFNPVIIEKGGATEAIRTVFMRRDLDDWERAEDLAIPYTRQQAEQFSPRSRAILEIQSKRDLEILEKIYSNAVLVGDDGPDGWGIRYRQGDFNMTSDSHLFPPRPQWEAKGYRPDEYSRWLLGDWRPIEELWEELGVDPSRPEPVEVELEDWLFDTTASPERREAEARFVHGHWLKPGDVARTEWRVRCAQPPYDGLPVARAKIPPGVLLSRDGDAWMREEDVRDIALPLYQGIMIQPFVASARGWLSGTGLRAKWDYNETDNLRWNPQYLMGNDLGSSSYGKIGYREVARSTDARSFIGAVLPSFPCGHKVPILHIGSDTADKVSNCMALFNSFVFDWLVRQRLGAAALAWYVLVEGALPRIHETPQFFPIVKRLNLYPNLFSPVRATRVTSTHDALHLGERLRLRSMIDAMSCASYGCNSADLHHILRDSDLPIADVGIRSRPSGSLDARGFWRVDRDVVPELRHTVLTLIAFHDLESKINTANGDREKGIEAFLAQNHGEGWLLPETLRLSDYGLGHDDRANAPQPVASRLGPRFYDWQLVQSAEESWRECHVHARNLLGADGYAVLLVDLIERRVSEGEDYLDILTDGFVHKLSGEGGYITVLLEVRDRNVFYETSYWELVERLRHKGHLNQTGYDQLLDKLHERKLLNDMEFRHRSGRDPRILEEPVLPKVAETGSDYDTGSPPDDAQKSLFK